MPPILLGGGGGAASEGMWRPRAQAVGAGGWEAESLNTEEGKQGPRATVAGRDSGMRAGDIPADCCHALRAAVSRVADGE